MSFLTYAHLDQHRDRLVVVVRVEELGDEAFEAAERRMMALAEGATASDEVNALEGKIALAFVQAHHEIWLACPDRRELEPMPLMMSERDRLVISLQKKISKFGLLPAVVRAAAGLHPGARVSVARTWEMRFPNLGGHEHAVESADMGFDELDVCHKLAGDCTVWAELVVKKRRPEMLEIARTLTSLYATRIDGDGDRVTLHRLADGATVSRRELEQRARRLLG